MIYIASDHAGVDMKLAIMKHLDENYPNEEYTNLGTDNPQCVDYPDYAHALCQAMDEYGVLDIGILICGTGIGMSMVANRYDNIRCAVVYNEEVAIMTRKHNDANVMALGARQMPHYTATRLVDVFIETVFEGGRHGDRVDKINIQDSEEIYEESPLKTFFGVFGITW
jgi:ribose 5-phosphate isomerase B